MSDLSVANTLPMRIPRLFFGFVSLVPLLSLALALALALTLAVVLVDPGVTSNGHVILEMCVAFSAVSVPFGLVLFRFSARAFPLSVSGRRQWRVIAVFAVLFVVWMAIGGAGAVDWFQGISAPTDAADVATD